MKIIIDESVEFIYKYLKNVSDGNWDIVSVCANQLQGYKDEDVWDLAIKENRVLISSDLNFQNFWKAVAAKPTVIIIKGSVLKRGKHFVCTRLVNFLHNEYEKMKGKLISLTVPGYSVYDETEGRFISQQGNCTKFLVKPDFLTQFQTLAIKYGIIPASAVSVISQLKLVGYIVPSHYLKSKDVDRFLLAYSKCGIVRIFKSRRKKSDTAAPAFYGKIIRNFVHLTSSKKISIISNNTTLRNLLIEEFEKEKSRLNFDCILTNPETATSCLKLLFFTDDNMFNYISFAWGSPFFNSPVNFE
jgi:predicted nuclease of predicted toxin-antitoxin system